MRQRTKKEILHGNLEGVETWLFQWAQIAGLGHPTQISYDVLLYACYSVHLPIVLYLLKVGFDPNIVGKKGELPLTAICKSDNPEMCQLLISFGAKLDIHNGAGYTPLTIACRYS